ncbi:MAG TPA: hypothetical protein VGV38_23120 [Pyrinomonadaceae bacterium]|nr:hypothetical protein [Pyrinomonadaceae bacterium]
MTAPHFFDHLPDGWLAFELSVLRRLRFRSVANPFAGECDLDAYLKRWGVRVAANDAARWAFTKAVARVRNNSTRLSAEEVAAVLEEAYVPRHRLHNAALRRWFNETDAWWFDNVRLAAEQLEDDHKRALVLTLGMAVGDYVLSFDEDTRELRQPLSRVFRRLWESEARPSDNGEPNACSNLEARDFLASQRADLLFLRLPRPARRPAHFSHWAWREEWVRGSGDFWDEFEGVRQGRLGSRVETKQQYLRHVEELLEAALHLPAWAIVHTEDGLISSEDLLETVRRVRRVATIYTKDFTELLGARAALVTA